MTAYPLVTPNPGIHTAPAVPQPTPQSALGVARQATGVSTGVAGQVATALTGVGGLGNPFGQIAAFGQAALGAVADLAQLLIQLGVDAVEGVVEIIQGAVSGVLGLINAIVQGLGGIFGGSGNPADAQLILQATAQTIAASSASIQAMQAADSADSGDGANVFVNFATNSLSGFTGAHSGAATGIAVNASGYAQLQTSGNGTGYELYTETPTKTDDQLISAVYYNAPGSYNYFGLAEGSGYDVLIGRSNESMTTYVYAEIAPILYSIHNVVSGVDTVVAQYTPPAPTFYAGAPYSFQCGFDGDDNPVFQIIVNGIAIMTFVDESHVTNYGEDYRYCGFGLAEFAGMSPSQIASFGFADDAPGPVVGDMFLANNESSTQTALSDNINPTLPPASFYSNVEIQTSNYTYDAVHNKLTVSVSGTYVVKVTTQWLPSSSATYAYFGIALFKNGIAYDVGDTVVITSPGALPFFLEKTETFIVQLDAGDYIQPSFVSYSNSTGALNKIVGAQDANFFCTLTSTGAPGA